MLMSSVLKVPKCVLDKPVISLWMEVTWVDTCSHMHIETCCLQYLQSSLCVIENWLPGNITTINGSNLKKYLYPVIFVFVKVNKCRQIILNPAHLIWTKIKCGGRLDAAKEIDANYTFLKENTSNTNTHSLKPQLYFCLLGIYAAVQHWTPTLYSYRA